MSIEIERFSTQGFLPPWVIKEHIARYEFAGNYVKNRTIVDCACGAGLGTSYFLQSGANHIYGFDISNTSIEEARLNCVSDVVEFHVADAQKLPLLDETIDIFISLETIEHIQNDEALIREIARLLRREGLLICSTPNREVTNPGSGPRDRPLNPFHIREYSKNEFIALLATHFSSVTLYGQNPRSDFRVKLGTRISRFIGVRVTARLTQALKLIRFISYEHNNAKVVPLESDRHYEYLVAICRK
jgi:ubiquinone/menaquinone biosynthesis C-methylase UbiE